MRSRSRSLVICDLEDTKRLGWVVTAILRL
jgi:hypothetical protein